jgi:hypothetical protein
MPGIDKKWGKCLSGKKQNFEKCISQKRPKPEKDLLWKKPKLKNVFPKKAKIRKSLL